MWRSFPPAPPGSLDGRTVARRGRSRGRSRARDRRGRAAALAEPRARPSCSSRYESAAADRQPLVGHRRKDKDLVDRQRSASCRFRLTFANRPPDSARCRVPVRCSQNRTDASTTSSATFWIEAAIVSGGCPRQISMIVAPRSISSRNGAMIRPSSPSRKCRPISAASAGSPRADMPVSLPSWRTIRNRRRRLQSHRRRQGCFRSRARAIADRRHGDMSGARRSASGCCS